MANGLLKKIENAARSIVAVGALGLAALLPTQSKAVPATWNSINDIIAQAPAGESIAYTSSNSSVLPGMLTGILYVIDPVWMVGNPVGGFDMQNGVVTSGYINRDSATRWGLLDGDTANTSGNPVNTYETFWEIFYRPEGSDAFHGYEEILNSTGYSVIDITVGGYGFQIPGSFTFTMNQVPEPSILGLLATGLSAAALRRKKIGPRKS